MALREAGERRRPCTSFAADHDEPCANCGSYRHITARCTHRDDAVEGTSIPGHNGRYEGPLEVRHLPPGFSYIDRAGVPEPIEPACDQVWRSPTGKLFRIAWVGEDMVMLRIQVLNWRGRSDHFTRAKLATLRARWSFVRKG
jgi:hypothetical protein